MFGGKCPRGNAGGDRDIVPALAWRSDPHGKGVEAAEGVLAKALGPHFLLQSRLVATMMDS